jgi:two-component system response regulator YesN
MLKLKNRINSRLFVKYLLSYLIVLCLPLFILGLILYNMFFDVLEREIEKNNSSMLTSVQNNLDNSINELNTISYQIYNDPMLTPFKMSNMPLGAMEGIKELKKYVVGNNMPYSVFVYYDQLDRVFSSSAMFTVEEFKRFFRFTDWDSGQFYNDMRNIHTNTTRMAEDVTCYSNDCRFIKYIVPNHFASNQMMVFFLIPEKTITDISKISKGNLMILNEESEVVVSLSDDLEQNQIRSIISDPQLAYSDQLKLKVKDYFVSYTKSATTGWKYLFYVPIQVAMKELFTVKTVFLYAQLFILLLGGGVIYYVMVLNYRPIRQLKHFAESKLGWSLNMGNEIEAVRFTLNHISKSQEELHVKVNNSRQAMKEYVLLNFLKGNYASIEEFNRDGSDLGLAFHNLHYCVLVVSISTSQGELAKQSKLISLIEDNLPEHVEGYGKTGLSDDEIILLLALDDSHKPDFKTYIRALHQLIYRHAGIQTTIGVGNIYGMGDQLGKSYIEASTSLDYRLIKGKNKLIFFDEVVPSSSVVSFYPVQELKVLELSVLEGNIGQIETILDRIQVIIEQNGMSLFEARRLCFDMINTIMKSITTINKKFLESKKEFPDVLALAEFETVEELWQTVKKISLVICHYIQDNEERKIRDFTDKLVAYIHENYDQCQFSIQNMADSFGMSPSNLAHYFKLKKGQTVSDYVNYMRIEKAKELLLNTDDPLNQIVGQIGYTDVSSFVRKFKGVTGTTPGNFRKMNE